MAKLQNTQIKYLIFAIMGNTFGNLFRLTTFGESHGKYIGGVIDGCPSNIKIDFESIQNKLNRRKPGQSKITTQRNENDKENYLVFLKVKLWGHQ